MQGKLLSAFDHNRLTSGGVWPYNRGAEIGTHETRGRVMSKAEFDQEWAQTMVGVGLEVRERAVRSRVFPRDRSGQYTTIPVMSRVHVWWADGRVHMAVDRDGCYYPTFVTLSDAETDMIMSWAWDKVRKGEGIFTPADGGWAWHRRWL